ncbi:MAG TPA: HNH endonuclease [Candidatus Xenobia bacterium]
MNGYVLVLNVSYEFLNIATLERAVKLIYKGKAEIVEAMADKELGSSTFRIKMPSIIRMLYYIVRPFRELPLTKKNILLRDNHRCQYCGRPGDTIDHVLPRSRNGPSTWENCVCACSMCNTRKNSRTPDEANMKLARKPRRPTSIPWILIKRDAQKEGWARYLFWNLSIEEQMDAGVPPPGGLPQID